MTRSYRHIQQYEKEILKLKEKGLTHMQIALRLGFSKEQVKGFIKRHHKKEQKIATGVVIKHKGRPRKDETVLPPSVQQLSKVAQLQYELALKERENKRLKIENELMRDFLSLTGRK